MVKGRAALSANCRLQCYIRMTLWKCITFFSTQPFQPSSKAPLLHCYRNTSRGEFDLCAFPMSPPSLSSSVEHNFSLSHRLPATVSLRWPPDDPPLVAHSNTRGRDAPAGNISTQEGEKQKYVALFFFFSLENILLEDKCFIQGDIQVHSKCRDYTHRVENIQCRFNVIFLYFMSHQQKVRKS